MGHHDNITEKTFSTMAESENTTAQELKEQLYQRLVDDKQPVNNDPMYKELFEKAAAASNQSVDQAEEETQKLLKKTLGK